MNENDLEEEHFHFPTRRGKTRSFSPTPLTMCKCVLFLKQHHFFLDSILMFMSHNGRVGSKSGRLNESLLSGEARKKKCFTRIHHVPHPVFLLSSRLTLEHIYIYALKNSLKAERAIQFPKISIKLFRPLCYDFLMS